MIVGIQWLQNCVRWGAIPIHLHSISIMPMSYRVTVIAEIVHNVTLQNHAVTMHRHCNHLIWKLCFYEDVINIKVHRELVGVETTFKQYRLQKSKHGYTDG